MAMIRILNEPMQIVPSEGKVYLEIDNGDLAALSSIKEKFHFINYESLIRFALVVLLNAQDNNIYLDKGDEKVKITPSPDVIETSSAT